MIYREPPHTEILDEGIYKNFHYAIVSYGSHPCAYVELPKGHKYYGKSYDDVDDIDISCHGGITFSSYGMFSDNNPNHRNGFWIGWDYDHISDYNSIRARYYTTECSYVKKWTTEEILGEVKNVINQL